ncbi:MAG: TadE/TadG family type IV pilus assembly protein [Candidatus Rokuibacteriota bacterium]
MPAPARNDRGAITASVAVMPIVFTLFFVVIQVSLWYHGRSVATAAAHHALEAARSYNVQDRQGAGSAAGQEFLDQVGGFDEDGPPDVQATPEQVTVTVSGDPLSVVPGMTKHIEVTLTGPVERIIP